MRQDHATTREGNGGMQQLSSVSLLKKVVLLIDVNSETRESRAKVMRTLGVTVHSASSARTARSKLGSGAYDLVLVDLGADNEGAEALVQEIRQGKPRQLVAFLVGSPLFVSSSLTGKRSPKLRTIRVTPPAVVPKTIASGKRFDFGQKVKDAEAEEVA
jgi:CheY-like chemotaxis protein